MKIYIKQYLPELRVILRLFFYYHYYLIFFFPILKPIQYFFSKKNKYLVIYVNDNNFREVYLAKLISKNFKVHLYYKEKPTYIDLLEKNKINYDISSSYYIFFFNFFINKSVKIVSCAQTNVLLPLLIYGNNIIVSIYDSIIGQGLSKFLEIFEYLNFNQVKYVIERDLRFHKNYKEIYKKNKIKNVFIADEVKPLKTKKLEEIHAVSVGWIDNDICNISETIKFLCGQNIFVHIFLSNKMMLKKVPYLKELKKIYPNYLIIKTGVFGDELKNEISKYHLGISPHQTHETYEKLHYKSSYYANCSSNRVVDFISYDLVNLTSKKYIYTNHIINKFGGKKIFYEDFFLYKDNLKKIIKSKYDNNKDNNKYQKNKNFFNDELKSLKLLNFIKSNFKNNLPV